MTKCNVNHPTLRGVRCDQKRGHKGFHGYTPHDLWDELENVRYHWAKGRGRIRDTARTTARSYWTFSS